MKVVIDKGFIETLKATKGGLLKVELEEVKTIYKFLDDKSCRVLLMHDMCFVLFKELSGVEFAVENYRKEADFSFVDKAHIEVVNVSKKDGNYFKFVIDELFQGSAIVSRVMRFGKILLPLVILNVLGYMYADSNSINEVFSGLLTAVSIFIAVFSLFVTSHDYLTRKRLALFERGQLSYYFAIDKYITQTGIFAILFSIYGLIITSGGGNGKLYESDIHNIIIVALLNIVFIMVYIILRSLVEFYIVRPGKFIMADLKSESVRNYWKNGK